MNVGGEIEQLFNNESVKPNIQRQQYSEKEVSKSKKIK